MNEKFYELSNEKQQVIINAALYVFSKYDYKKASTEEIAKEAGISKGLLFHYFKNKKNLYLFLYDYSIEFISNKMMKDLDLTEKDFFKLITNSQDIKSKIMKQHPYVFQFSINAYYEECPEIADEISGKNKVLLSQNTDLVLSIIDKTKFKENVDIEMLFKAIVWCGDGYLKEKFHQKKVDIDEVSKEFKGILEMFKNNLYKEEYL